MIVHLPSMMLLPTPPPLCALLPATSWVFPLPPRPTRSAAGPPGPTSFQDHVMSCLSTYPFDLLMTTSQCQDLNPWSVFGITETHNIGGVSLHIMVDKANKARQGNGGGCNGLFHFCNVRLRPLNLVRQLDLLVVQLCKLAQGNAVVGANLPREVRDSGIIQGSDRIVQIGTGLTSLKDRSVTSKRV